VVGIEVGQADFLAQRHTHRLLAYEYRGSREGSRPSGKV
jgi:hypothetical protein